MQVSDTDTFESRIPLDQLSVLLDFGHEFRFDPISSVEMESYFVDLLKRFQGNSSELRAWIGSKIEQSFRWLTSPPRWIQNPDWQVCSNGPMLFIGQIDSPPVEGIFHDEACFYIFFDAATAECRTIMQIA